MSELAVLVAVAVGGSVALVGSAVGAYLVAQRRGASGAGRPRRAAAPVAACAPGAPARAPAPAGAARAQWAGVTPTGGGAASAAPRSASEPGTPPGRAAARPRVGAAGAPARGGDAEVGGAWAAPQAPGAGAGHPGGAWEAPRREDEAAIQHEFLRAASRLSDDELREFVDDHIAGELAAICSLPPEHRAQAFRALCAEWHPDKCPAIAEIATAVFQRLQAHKRHILSLR